MDETGVLKVNLGPEWDAGLLSQLKATVLSLGGSMSETSTLVAGSQEISSYDIRLPDGRLVAFAETYIGLCVSGPAPQVRKLIAHWAGPNNSFKPKPLRGSA